MRTPLRPSFAKRINAMGMVLFESAFVATPAGRDGVRSRSPSERSSQNVPAVKDESRADDPHGLIDVEVPIPDLHPNDAGNERHCGTLCHYRLRYGGLVGPCRWLTLS